MYFSKELSKILCTNVEGYPRNVKSKIASLSGKYPKLYFEEKCKCTHT